VLVELINNSNLYKEVKRIAYSESEIDLGVNPICNAQAKTSYLSERDFDYIAKVSRLVESRMSDNRWLNKTILLLKNNSHSCKGIRFDDELYKPGRGILKSFLK
jgi:hypothetical protein